MVLEGEEAQFLEALSFTSADLPEKAVWRRDPWRVWCVWIIFGQRRG